jgi:hypothetical protein
MQMTKWTAWALVLAGCTALTMGFPTAEAQTTDKVYHSFAPEQVATFLTDLEIKFTKNQPKDTPRDVDFEFRRKGFDLRLTLREGKMLWIAAYFPKTSLEKINDWNVKAKLSRAVLVRIANKDYAAVEAQLDVGGGCTDNMAKQFIRRFDDEVANFDRFIQ